MKNRNHNERDMLIRRDKEGTKAALPVYLVTGYGLVEFHMTLANTADACSNRATVENALSALLTEWPMFGFGKRALLQSFKSSVQTQCDHVNMRPGRISRRFMRAPLLFSVFSTLEIRDAREVHKVLAKAVAETDGVKKVAVIKMHGKQLIVGAVDREKVRRLIADSGSAAA
ncbi:hypothetical protein [Hyphococcus lacteus]|uniref:CBS domain-containing protein n=1 Tax=Hyphococcus lacteus TaxID=3143536 RepID=A0ABV3Z3N4_9PROT